MELICILSLKQEWEQLIYSANTNIYMYITGLNLFQRKQMQEYYFQIKLPLDCRPPESKQNDM